MDVWFDALAVGGVISIEVLDVADFMERWMEVSGSDLKLLDLENAFLGVVNEQLIPASIHGGGVRGVFDANRLENLLLMAGFSDVRTRPGARGRVRMEAIKATRKGERQVAPGLELVRADHRARYEFACQKIVAGARVLDVACGVGYGSWMVACRTQALEVLGIDIDPGALSYARAHYAHARVQYQQGDITQLELPEQSIDVAISLETIEHIAEPERFLRCLARALRPGGILLCSTPNEEVFPLRTAANPYHHRHYTPSEFEGLLGRGGFDVTERHSQMDRDPGNLVPGWNGLFNLAVCRVRSGSTSE
jgi:SAM-dependent methyltransferase